ncbi:aldo/keto reductase [Candidatus Korarchaeum cryptofilum OPF8]|uniref:Aldo/keto reductase n=2 Tax=Candidatus Korarchaeum cryptofilum TaxID=498846 RepID=B1L4J4_KORCO|nr:aldo/keto reductase [Candidatus Korarchaeum cryptofilum OPF8]
MRMEFRYIGDVKVSEVGLGTWQFSDSWGVTNYDLAKSIIERALDVGVNFFDTAAVYGMGMSERFLGQALKELGERENVFIATKIPGEFLSRHDVFKATKRSMERLGSYIDLMQVHWPPCWDNIPTCEYMRALEELVHIGVIRMIGLSDFPPELIESAWSCLSTEDIVSIQVKYNLVERDAEKEIIPYAEAYDLSVLAWSPLAKGALSGKYRPENLPEFSDVREGSAVFHPENFRQVYEIVKLLEEIGAKYGKKPSQVALKWLLMASEKVIVIPGAKSPEQVEENTGASGWTMSLDDWMKLEEESGKIRITRVLW